MPESEQHLPHPRHPAGHAAAEAAERGVEHITIILSKMNGPIFVNYRRDDSAGEAMAIRNALTAKFGPTHVFMDVSSIEAGASWREEIERYLNDASIVLSIIGPDWLRVGSDEWGKRRIDQKSDWLRKELESAFKTNKTVIPLLVKEGKLPPSDVLPRSVQKLSQCNVLKLRHDSWDQDIGRLIDRLASEVVASVSKGDRAGPYPQPNPADKRMILVSQGNLNTILREELNQWKCVESSLPENSGHRRTELFREFRFRSFADAVGFMHHVAPGCDIAMHHPRWENIFKTLRVYLTTWDLNHSISNRDIEMAHYFESAYCDYLGEAKPKKSS